MWIFAILLWISLSAQKLKFYIWDRWDGIGERQERERERERERKRKRKFARKKGGEQKLYNLNSWKWQREQGERKIHKSHQTIDMVDMAYRIGDMYSFIALCKVSLQASN